MRNNLPVTGHEIELQSGQTLVSRTDERGVIAYVNRDFIAISGYSEAELIGQPHNIVRHPDMPPALFEDMWAKLKAGRPWIGMVKNRCKNGDHYWVEAHAAPVYEGQQRVGYMSVRRRASREAIVRAEREYADIRSARRSRFEVVNGILVAPRLGRRFNPLWRLDLGVRLWLLALFGVGVALLVAELALAGSSRALLWSVLAGAAVFATYSAWWLHRDVAGRLADATRLFQRMASNHFDDPVDIDRNDEVGAVLLGLKSMQIRLGFQIQDNLRRGQEMARVQRALDVAATNVMVADQDCTIIYLNESLQQTLKFAERSIRRDLPDFSATGLLGRNIDAFHRQPSHQRALLDRLQANHQATITIGEHTFLLSITAVRDDAKHCLGFAVEWKDRTQELRIEQEVSRVVEAAAKGDYSGRITLEDKNGFLRALAEGIDRLLASTADSLSDIQQLLAAIAEGDLSRRITRDYQGVLGEMKDSTNQTAERLGLIVRGIQQASDTINTAAREIASGNADLSARTEQQAATLEEAAASVQELTATVRLNTERSLSADQLASGATQLASRGGQVVSEVVQVMDSISSYSRKIEDIIGVIDGIAFQTNILALNAAVEAARAGDQGRGFAVVATEVRALAGRSASAAKEIKQLIASSSETVQTGAGRVGEAGRTMTDIVAAVTELNGLMRDIAVASREQAAGIEQVSDTVSQMDQVTQQNAALVEEASAAAHAMEEQARSLGVSVSAFKLDANVVVARRHV